MNEASTYEFVVAEIPEGRRLAFILLARIGILAAIGALLALCLLRGLYPLAIIPLAILGVFLYFWRIFNREMEYSITAGTMTFSYIMGGMRRKKVLELNIKEMKEIAPVTDDTMEHLIRLGVVKDYFFVSSASADDMYYAVFDDDGKRCVIYFEATERALSILYFYNHSTVRSAVSR